MLNQEYLLKHPELFQYVIGINFNQFQKLLPKFTGVLRQTEIKKAYSRKRLRATGGGRKSKLANDYQKLFFTLFYYKTYPTFRFAQVIYGLDKRNVQLWVKFLAPILFSALGYELSLKMRKKISRWDIWLEEYPELSEFIVDCTERLIQRPKDNQTQQEHYSGKKKTHCVKNQILISPQTKKILSVSRTLPGTIHDKKIFDDDPTFLRAPPDSVGMGDSAYQGTDGNNPHLRMVIPKKKPPGGKLSQEEKATNRAISSIRVRVEHSLSYLKHFGILNQKFRGRITNQQNLDLPIKTIACIYNFTRVPT